MSIIYATFNSTPRIQEPSSIKQESKSSVSLKKMQTIIKIHVLNQNQKAKIRKQALSAKFCPADFHEEDLILISKSRMGPFSFQQ